MEGLPNRRHCHVLVDFRVLSYQIRLYNLSEYLKEISRFETLVGIAVRVGK